MIQTDSILRRLPVGLDKKQALFLDGIRHVAEIATFAYSRLGQTLTYIALNDPDGVGSLSQTTSAFLDAWAMVDAIDRFRNLWLQLPNARPAKLPADAKPFKEVSQPFRDLRNVADHLAQRADFIISKNSSALGSLSWFTGTSQDPLKGRVCAIIPGTISQQTKGRFSDPFEESFDWPTGNIWLAAGGFRANLSDILPHLRIRIERLEISINEAISRLPQPLTHAVSDMLITYELTPSIRPRRQR